MLMIQQRTKFILISKQKSYSCSLVRWHLSEFDLGILVSQAELHTKQTYLPMVSQRFVILLQQMDSAE